MEISIHLIRALVDPEKKDHDPNFLRLYDL